MAPPSVFLSYSHDSPAHKQWVRRLAEHLRAGGVDATLDQWDLRPGADLSAFMEEGIRRADRVLMVCSASYVQKAEDRKDSGVSFERLIVTGEVAARTDTVKFIPLVRDNGGPTLVPRFLGPRLWLDFRDDATYQERLEDLLRELHAAPRHVKPPLGTNPFGAAPASPPATAPWRQLQPPSIPPSLPLIQIPVKTGTLKREGRNWRVTTTLEEVTGYREELAEGVALTMLRIPAGTFLMGSPPEEPERGEVEGPQHPVRLEEFYLGQTPITQAQWQVVAGWPTVERQLDAAPSEFKGDLRPVECVQWHDAVEFCRRLSQHTGRSYGLPSESQWEYACRAGTTTPFSFGAILTTELANYDGNYTYQGVPKGTYRKETTKLDSFPANAWGLQDLHGNVWEWCEDHWHDRYNGAPGDGRPWIDRNAEEDALRLLRGGSWYFRPAFCRSAYRVGVHPDGRDRYRGFRVCYLPQD